MILACIVGCTLFAIGQTCGTSVLGGTINPGTYNGSGFTPGQAMSSLWLELGLSAPTDCAGCTGGQSGCTGGWHINGNPVRWPEPHYNEGCECFKVAMTFVNARTWDKVCSSCN